MSENLDLLSGLHLGDQTETVEGGGGPELDPVPAGPKRARIVLYAELGERLAAPQFQDETKSKKNKRAVIGLEIFGKDIPRNGDKPRLLFFWTNISQHVKANFPKTAALVNYDGKTPHIALAAQATKPCIVNVKVVDGKDGKKQNEVDNDGVLAISPPVIHAPDEDGEMVARPVTVPDAQTSPAILLWDQATPAMIKSVEAYPFVIKQIKAAANYKGSKVQALLEGGEAAAAIANDKPASKQPSQQFDDFED